MTFEHSPILDRSPTKGRKTWSSQHFYKTVNNAQPVKKTSNASERAVERVGTDAFVAAICRIFFKMVYIFCPASVRPSSRARPRGSGRVGAPNTTRSRTRIDGCDAHRTSRSMPIDADDAEDDARRTAPHRNASHPRRSIDRSNGLLDP